MAMDTVEIRGIVSQLGKAPDAKTLLELLELLNDGVAASETLLRETKVGVAVNKFRTNEDAEVAQAAKKIIKKWKDQVSAEKKAKVAPVKQTTAAVSVPQADKFITTKTRTPSNDGIKVNVHEDSTRNGAITGIYTALAIESTDAPKLILGISKSIEDAVFSLCKDKVDDNYRLKTRSLVMNLRNKKNPELRSSILNGDLKPAKLVTMSSKELAPEALKKEMETLHQKNLFDAQGAVQKRAVTDRFTCGKCKKKEVSYYQMQTRSADEPLTTFCTCESCGNRWKFC